MPRPRRAGWSGVENGAQGATNDGKRVAQGATNGVIRGAEAAKTPLAPAPLGQSSCSRRKFESAGIIANVAPPLSVGSAPPLVFNVCGGNGNLHPPGRPLARSALLSIATVEGRLSRFGYSF